MTSNILSSSKVHVALIHHPVVDKNGDAITAAVTALDLHDIARAGKTYGIGSFYVVTPLEDQQTLVREIVDHWVTGYGAGYNPDRQAALALIDLQSSLHEAISDLTAKTGFKPYTVVTSARLAQSDLGYGQLRKLASHERHVLVLFGTAWGLSDDVMEAADYRLAPIQGCGSYNHLAVRSAVSIILDRILGAFDS